MANPAARFVKAFRPSLPSTLGLGAALLLLVGLLDYWTGIEIALSLFYLFPVALVTWYAGRGWGLAFAAAGAVVWGVDDYVLGGQPVSHAAIAFWNSGIRGGFFALVCILLGRVHRDMRRAVEISNLKSEMLTFVCHEFSNHLVVLDMSLLLLREQGAAKDPERQEKYYDMMSRSLRLLKLATANFLNAARMESGRFALNLRRTELRRLVTEALSAMAPLIKQKRLQVEGDYPEQVIPLHADPDALALAMSNLIGNAVKYTPDGGRIFVRLSLPDSSGPEVVVSVEDSGIGIPKEEQERIFSGFYRTTAAMAAAKGFGVGLKVTRDILESHGTRLELESSPGRGSRFFFRLPVLREPAAAGQA